MDIKQRLYEVGVIPVIKMDRPEHALPLAEALVRGGLNAAEITFRSAAAAPSIRAIAQQFPEMLVCAGTVLDPKTAYQAVEAGAQAVISPGTNLETVRWCRDRHIPVIPGTATPTEVEACMREGLDLVKLFPAQTVGGVGMLRSLEGPYPQMSFMPTGGIKPGNVTEFLTQKNVTACGGTWIVPEGLLAGERFDEIEALAREAAGLRDAARADGNARSI